MQLQWLSSIERAVQGRGRKMREYPRVLSEGFLTGGQFNSFL